MKATRYIFNIENHHVTVVLSSFLKESTLLSIIINVFTLSCLQWFLSNCRINYAKEQNVLEKIFFAVSSFVKLNFVQIYRSVDM